MKNQSNVLKSIIGSSILLLTTILSPIAHADENETRCLAIALYNEARGEPYEGQLAVVGAVLERTQDSYFGANTICKVIYAKGQFQNITRWNGITESNTLFAKMMRTAEDTLTRSANGEVFGFPGASFFTNGRFKNPRFKLEGHVGKQYFYSLRK